jgi:biotin carboxyl carrier protein
MPNWRRRSGRKPARRALGECRRACAACSATSSARRGRAIRRSSSPGDTVARTPLSGIIEVMKLMNPIRAGVAGTVVAILADNGKAVEEGQPLVRVRLKD